MKKIITLLLLVMALSPLAAMTQTFSLGLSGGYSSGGESPLIGLGGAAIDVADISEIFGMGFGSRLDLAYEFSGSGGFFGGIMAGLGIEIRPIPVLNINFIIGPTATLDLAAHTAFGFGIGADLSISYFFVPDSTVGITAGVTAYPQFIAWKDMNDARFVMETQGYVAVSFRSRGFPLAF